MTAFFVPQQQFQRPDGHPQGFAQALHFGHLLGHGGAVIGLALQAAPVGIEVPHGR